MIEGSQSHYPNWTVVTNVPMSAWMEARNWCKENLSEGRFTYSFSDGQWSFENKEDALLFTIRWSTNGNNKQKT